MLSPFLTELDDRAKIKGSRDPLGVQPIWSRLGRHVVANLTTVSNSVRDFTVLLLGYHFAQCVADDGGSDAELTTFLKWEQLAGYARAYVNKESGFRGTERVARRLAESDRVRLGADADAQILADQKVYGLWGLYTVPARSSGLLEGDPARLTPEARRIVVQSLLPSLEGGDSRISKSILERLRSAKCEIDVRENSRDAAVLAGVARVLKGLRAPERALYRERLLFGSYSGRDAKRDTRGRQKLFAELLAETLEVQGWMLTPESLRVLAVRASKHGEIGMDLAEHLERICAAELLLAPAVAFFEHLLTCNEMSPREIAARVREHWGNCFAQTIQLEAVESLEFELRGGSDDTEVGRLWILLAAALHDARYEDAIALVLKQNAATMRARSAAAPWAHVRDGKLRVQFVEERGRLPGVEELPRYWRHAYFIESLRNVAATLGVDRA
jgi:hypothetical protein